VHRYDLRIKVKTSQSDDEEFKIVQQCLQKLLDITLQANNSSTIPPYYELDRADETVPDINNAYSISSLDSCDKTLDLQVATL
jgi:hypothetical protein